MPQLPKAYTPHDVEGAIYERWLAADVFAPDGAGSTADPALPPFTIIQPPPNITGSLHLGHAQRTAVEDLMIRHARMRGHPTLFLPGLDHASIAAQFVLDGILAREGESRQSLGRERYLERMRAFVATTREVMLGQQRRVGGSFDWGRLRLHDGRRLGEGRPGRVHAPVRGRSRVPHRSAGQLVSGLPDERQRSRGRRHARDRHALVGALPPDRPRDRRARSGRDDHRGDHPTRDDPRRHGGRGPPGRPALRGRWSGARSGSRSSSATCRSSPTTSSTRRSGPARSRSRRPTITTTTRRGFATVSRRRPSSRTTASVAGTGTRYDGMDRFAARTAIVADLTARGDLVGRRPRTRWSSGAASAATTSSNRGSRRSGSSGPAPLAARALEATRQGRTRILPGAVREDLGALADQHPRLERVAPALVGAPDPGLVLPGRPRDGVARGGRPLGVLGVRTPCRGADPGSGHLRHLVQLRALAVVDPRLARRHTRSRDLLPDIGHGDGLRHHLLLGRPDDDARPRADREGTVPHGLSVRPHPRPVRPEDVEDEGQRRRSARRHRRRRAPMHFASPSSTVRRRATTNGSARPSSSTPGTSRTSSGTRRATSSVPARRRSRTTPNDASRTSGTSVPPSAGCCPGRRRPPKPSTPP